MAVYSQLSAGDISSIDDMQKVRDYLYKLNKNLKYMFNNLTPEDNYSELARLTMVTDGERQATMEATLEGINLNYVAKSGVVSAINLSEELVQIDASKIKLEGMVTVNGYFKVGLDGSIEARNGKFSGDISASTIRGSHIYSSYYGTNEDDFFITETSGGGTAVGMAGMTSFGDKVMRSDSIGSWYNPASQDDSRLSLNMNNGSGGFTILYVSGVSNDIATEIDRIWDAISGSGGDDPDPDPPGGGDDPIPGEGPVTGDDPNYGNDP